MRRSEKPAQRVIEVPFLRKHVLPAPPDKMVLDLADEIDVPDGWLPLIESILYDSVDLQELARRGAQLFGVSPREAEARLRQAAERPDNLFAIARVELPEELDVVLLCQGYAGVFVHSVQLWERLNRDRRALLISPSRPPYGLDGQSVGCSLVMEQLVADGQIQRYADFVQIVRAVLKTLPDPLLYLEHRSQSLFTFDLIHDRPGPTIIHDDGFFDSIYHGAAAARLRYGERRRRDILDEIHHSFAFANPTFKGMAPSPLTNRRLMEAGWFALRDADENWCWSKPPYEVMRGLYSRSGRARTRFAFVPPMIDLALRREDVPREDGHVLFTTTMHNIERKGIIELCRALRHVPDDVQTTCVLGQPDKLPPAVHSMAHRLTLSAPLPKTELVDLYHRCSVFCRVSRDESTPVSILEAMACGLPVITSDRVRDNLPLLEDGVTGFILSPSAPPQTFADRIQRVARDPKLRERMGEECRRRAASLGIDVQLERLTRYLPEVTPEPTPETIDA